MLAPILSLQEATAARDQTHGYKLDRSHTFAVTLFDDFERYAKVPEEYQDPAPQPYKPTVRTGLSSGSSIWFRSSCFVAGKFREEIHCAQGSA